MQRCLSMREFFSKQFVNFQTYSKDCFPPKKNGGQAVIKNIPRKDSKYLGAFILMF